VWRLFDPIQSLPAHHVREVMSQSLLWTDDRRRAVKTLILEGNGTVPKDNMTLADLASDSNFDEQSRPPAKPLSLFAPAPRVRGWRRHSSRFL
jgi:hypothetical protein